MTGRYLIDPKNPVPLKQQAEKLIYTNFKEGGECLPGSLLELKERVMISSGIFSFLLFFIKPFNLSHPAFYHPPLHSKLQLFTPLSAKRINLKQRPVLASQCVCVCLCGHACVWPWFDAEKKQKLGGQWEKKSQWPMEKKPGVQIIN